MLIAIDGSSENSHQSQVARQFLVLRKPRRGVKPVDPRSAPEPDLQKVRPLALGRQPLLSASVKANGDCETPLHTGDADAVAAELHAWSRPMDQKDIRPTPLLAAQLATEAALSRLKVEPSSFTPIIGVMPRLA